MVAQLVDWRCGLATAATACNFFGQKLYGVVHADGPDVFNARQVGVCTTLKRRGFRVFQIGTVATQIGPNVDAIFGVRSNEARQLEQFKRFLNADLFWIPAFRNTLARWLFVVFRHFAALHIGAKAAFEHANGIASVFAQQFAFWRDCGCFGFWIWWTKRASVTAFWIVRAANKCAARPRSTHRQSTDATVLAQPWIAAVFERWEQVWFQNFVYLLKDFSDPQFSGFRYRSREIVPEIAQHLLIVGLACADFIKLVFQIGGKVIADVFAEIIGQECSDQAALILRDQAVFVFFNIAAILNGGHDRRICRRATDAQFFHAFDQRRFGITRRRLGEMLFVFDGFLGRWLALGDLRQALVIVINNRVVFAFFIDRKEAVKQHHLAVCTQHNLAVSRAHVNGGAFHTRSSHLAGDGAFIDQIVKLALIRIDDFGVFHADHEVSWAHTFMGFLCVLCLVFIDARLGGYIVGAKFLANGFAGLIHGLWSHVDAVCPHVCDQASLV